MGPTKKPWRGTNASAKKRKPRIAQNIWYVYRLERETKFYQIWFRGDDMTKWKNVSQVSPSKMQCSLEQAEEIAKSVVKAAEELLLNNPGPSEADLRELCKTVKNEWANQDILGLL